MLVLRNEIRATHVSGQHSLFNQPVGGVTGARHDFFDASVFVAYDLRFGGFKVNRAALVARLQKRLIHTMQV